MSLKTRVLIFPIMHYFIYLTHLDLIHCLIFSTFSNYIRVPDDSGFSCLKCVFHFENIFHKLGY